jgi:hypothetical protein
MMRLHKFLVLIFIVASQAFCTPAGLEPFTEKAFLPLKRLDKAYFRSQAGPISEKAFEKKWKGALRTPINFFRAFVVSYYEDIKNVKGLGPVGLCYGDAHLGNFGFVLFKEGTLFVYNDLDDSGPCPVVADNLRFLTSLRLYRRRAEAQVPDLAKLYVDIVSKESEMESLPIDFFPNMEKVGNDILTTYTKGKKFLYEDSGLEEIDPKTTEAVKEAVRTATVTLGFPGPVVPLAVAGRSHRHGGSAGLDRFWILVDLPDGNREVLEMKGQLAPATYVGGWGAPLTDRFNQLTEEFWKGLTKRFYQPVSFEGTVYLIRSRKKSDIDLDELSKPQLRQLLRAETSLLAFQHQRYWQSWAGSEIKNKDWQSSLVSWLVDNSAVMAERYQAIYEKMQKAD